MDIELFTIIGWLIGGALAGSFVGAIVKRKKEGFGRFMNIVIGLTGGVIGGVIFEALNLRTPILSEFSVSARDILAAVAGSLILLLLVAIVRRLLRRKTED